MNKLTFVSLFLMGVILYSSCTTDTQSSGAEQVKTSKVDPAKAAAAAAAAAIDTLQSLATQAGNAAEFVYGIDVSDFQGDEVDFLDKQKDSLSFVICKATEGITYTDPEFQNNWKTIPEKGFIRGAYHFYRRHSFKMIRPYQYHCEPCSKKNFQPDVRPTWCNCSHWRVCR